MNIFEKIADIDQASGKCYYLAGGDGI